MRILVIKKEKKYIERKLVRDPCTALSKVFLHVSRLIAGFLPGGAKWLIADLTKGILFFSI